MISVEQAAERLRRIRSESIQDVYGMPDDDDGLRADRMLVIDEHLRETDATPITEEWAVSISVRRRNHNVFVIRERPEFMDLTMLPSYWVIETSGTKYLYLSTRGELLTVLRLFRITDTPTGAGT